MKLNPKGVIKANSLITQNRCEDEAAWSFSSDDGNHLLGPNGNNWEAYGAMHLGIDDSQPPDTKAHYGYPFGKLNEVYVSALKAIRSRAAQQGADDIYKAAGVLLDRCAKGADDGEHEYKVCKFNFDETKFGDQGMFSGYASIFGNVDYGGDIVERGAFEEIDKTKDGMVRVFYQHNPLLPIGKAHVVQDERGLKFDGQLLLSTGKGRDAYEQMKFGILDGMSIGYDVLQNGSEMRDSGVRSLKRLKLWEISPVTFGMNPQARIETVKGFKNIRQFEKFLRDVGGFSAARAKQIASVGFYPLSERRDDGTDEVKEVTQRIERLRVSDETPLTVEGLIASIKSIQF